MHRATAIGPNHLSLAMKRLRSILSPSLVCRGELVERSRQVLDVASLLERRTSGLELVVGKPTYTVGEAVLVRTQAGSAWTVRFASNAPESDEVIVVIGPEQLDQMAFQRPYSLAEIRGLTEGRIHVADDPRAET